MPGLTKKTDTEVTWYPVRVDDLERLLAKVIRPGRGYRHVKALRKNIAYNLQHVQFLDRCIEDLKLSSVLITQTWKSMIIVGCGIIESLLHFLLVAAKAHAQTEWELVIIAPGNPKEMEGEKRKVDSHIYRQLPSKIAIEMTLDQMLKKAETKKVLGTDHSIYAKLKKLRPLRNKVHLQQIADDRDTDWNAFQYSDVAAMAEVLRTVFTSNIFRPSPPERRYFDYLRKYYET